MTVGRRVGLEGGSGGFFADDGCGDGRRATLPAILLPLDTGSRRSHYGKMGVKGHVPSVLGRGWIAIVDAPGKVPSAAFPSQVVLRALMRLTWAPDGK